MANENRPSGLKPVSYLNGAPYTGQARLYSVASGNATAMYIGDPVTLSGTADANGLAGISIGVAGSAIIGVVVGFLVAVPGVSLVAATLDLTVRRIPASTVPTALVNIGLNTNFLVAAGATTASDSGTTTAATLTDSTTANLKLMGFVQRIDNTPASAYAKLLVKINNHVYANTGTAGI